jgi:hypothetical protein
VPLAHALSYTTRLKKRNKNKSIQVVFPKHWNTAERVTDEQTKANLSLGCVPLIGEKQ